MSTNQEDVDLNALLADLVAQTAALHFYLSRIAQKRWRISIVQVYWCFQHFL